MSRYFVSISVEELKSKVDAYLDDDSNIRHLTPIISKDLDKVKFDTENMESESDYGYGHAEDLVGYHVLENGMPILGVTAGGDWEWPIFFCIYFDGKKLRGYIPEKGNTWNTDTKKAYGNDDGADLKNAKKRWPIQYPKDTTDTEVEPYGDLDLMIEDITNRIIKKV
jgi:hypothetical protein